METYKVRKLDRVNTQKNICVSVPGSKSITNRALLISALAKGRSVISGTLFSDDSRHFLKCLQDLGFTVEIDEESTVVCVEGNGGSIPKKEASIYVGSAGTAARFLTALLGLSKGRYYIDASEQMRKRPMEPLLNSLIELGAKVIYHGEPGHFPFTIGNDKIVKNEITVNIDHSSQFLSALLMCAPLIKKKFHVHIEGTHGMSYIDITTKMMEQFGCKCKKERERTYIIQAGGQYGAKNYMIEPDVSAACYFYAMAPLLGISVTVKNIYLDSMQGDIKFLNILERLNCQLTQGLGGVSITGPTDRAYDGIEVDMGACSDQTMTLAAIAPFAKTATTIRNISHIRFQESNRIQAIVNELSRMGISCEELQDGVKIIPGEVKPAEIETYDDHRMAMAFSLTGLRAEGITIRDPQCCRKTFENYFEVLENVIEELLD